MRKKSLSVLLIAAMAISLIGCGKKQGSDKVNDEIKQSESAKITSAPVGSDEQKKLGYSFGLNETFHSDEPVTYSMYFSDASWYPMTDEWKTAGVFEEIRKATNVTLNITSLDSGDYSEQTKLQINAGNSCYIIPKVYDESAFVDGGAVVPVSDYVQYMPNFTDFYNKYNLKADVDTIVRSDGKYYRLPGMHEMAMQDYTLLLREDLFKGAGIDVKSIEKDWTWEDLYNALVKVKAYMVEKKICKADDYIWSDLWCGSESGQGNGGNLLKLMGASYGVPSGWAVDNGLSFDATKKEWYFASITNEYKEFVTLLNKFVKGGILDPETFTQDDTTATNKFYRGETALMSVNRGQLTTFTNGITEQLGAGNFELYYSVYPVAKNRYTAENSRLENGVMIATKALTELGADNFIKMMRFVDWLWYSEEAYTLIKWGVKDVHWKYVTDAATGLQIKALTDGWYCGGLGIAQTNDNQEDLRLKYGYAGGNFWYGHSLALHTDNFNPIIQDYSKRVAEYRETKPLNPSVVPTEDENEQISLWKTPLIDCVNTWTLQFVTGQKDINKDFDSYVAECKNLNCEKLVAKYNEMYNRKK